MTLELRYNSGVKRIESSSGVQNNSLTPQLFSNYRLQSCFLVLQSYFLNSELLTTVLKIVELYYFPTSSKFSNFSALAISEDFLPLIFNSIVLS